MDRVRAGAVVAARGGQGTTVEAARWKWLVCHWDVGIGMVVAGRDVRGGFSVTGFWVFEVAG